MASSVNDLFKSSSFSLESRMVTNGIKENVLCDGSYRRFGIDPSASCSRCPVPSDAKERTRIRQFHDDPGRSACNNAPVQWRPRMANLLKRFILSTILIFIASFSSIPDVYARQETNGPMPRSTISLAIALPKTTLAVPEQEALVRKYCVVCHNDAHMNGGLS